MTRRRLGPATLALVTVAGALAGGAGVATGSHSTFERVSAAAPSGNAAQPTQFVGASADGTRVFLRTEEALVPGDTDIRFDIYEHAAGGVTLVSSGPTGGNGDIEASLRGLSTDGSRAFFETAESLVAGDGDDCEPDDPAENGCVDVYLRAGGVTTLMTPGTPNQPAFFEDASDDGAIVFFSTQVRLAASDTDDEPDVYERAGGTTTHVSMGPTGGNSALPALFRGNSADGSRVFFATAERLVAADTDSAADVYERAGGTTSLVSTGPAGGNGDADAVYRGSTSAGTQVFFETAEQLTSSDTDSAIDVYQRSGGATTLVSTGPAGGNGAQDARMKKFSDGGTRLFFQTAERLTSSDTDGAIDVYERSGGATTLVSTGPAGGNAALDALLQDVSGDGATVVLGTVERLTADDTDNRFDVYSRAAGTTTLLTTAAGSGNGDFDAYFDGMSRDGRRVFFHTLEQLAGDTDAFPDVYERAGGVTTRVSRGPAGGSGAWIAVFVGASDDGSRVFFSSLEKLTSDDTDSNVDLHVARIDAGFPRPKSATEVIVPLVVAYRECTSPNRIHGPPPLVGGAANPSCAPPVQSSSYLTVGTPDANGRPVAFIGSVRYRPVLGNTQTPADEADVQLEVSLNDVRRKSDLADYTGEVDAGTTLQITDKYNGSSPVDSGTASQLSFRFAVPCTVTSDGGIGSSCSVLTSAEAVVPGAVKESARTVWQLAQVEVNDGGADDQAATSPNTTFVRQGIFVP